MTFRYYAPFVFGLALLNLETFKALTKLYFYEDPYVYGI